MSRAFADAEQAGRHYRDILRPVFEGRRFAVIGGPVAGLISLGATLRELGADGVFLFGSHRGTGPQPDADTPWFSLDHRSESVMEEFHRYEQALCDPPPAALEALDRFDPGGEARAIGAILLSDVPDVGGRIRFARRRAAWEALEDKVAIEAFWDAAGVARAPSRITRVDAAECDDAHRALDRGDGTVWAGDARQGVHGGAEYVRRVRSDAAARAALDFFAPRCDRIRIMPFLEGVPCSIHGVVFEDGLSVFQPVELVVLRRPGDGAFVYAGVSTFWDPPTADRDAMRAVARRTGEALREQVDYRGAFTVDGVLAREGFLPTEMNPRFGGGLGTLAQALPEIPFAPLVLSVAEGLQLDYRPDALEAIVTERADRRRFGRGSLPLRVASDETTVHPLVHDESGYRFAADGEDAQGTIVMGPGPMGSFFSFMPHWRSVPTGSWLAPIAVEAFAFADQKLGTEIGELETAQPQH